MTEDEIYRFLRKKFTGNISSREQKKLDQWLLESKENQNTFDTLTKVWQEKSSEPELINTEAVIDNIWQKSKHQNPSKIDWNYISKIAAIFLIFITTPLLVFQITQEADEQAVVAIVEEIIKSNPAGQKAKFYLPDGSLVWLNGASSLTYYSNFNETNRDISLTGEAFFEVAKNEAVPFRVVSGEITTTAMGTAFNVEAYPEVEQVKVSLLHGKVKVAIEQSSEEDILLDPGYQVKYSSVNEKVEKQSFDQGKVIGWKDGKLVFARANYQEVTHKLEKWYGVDITTIGDPPAGWRLSTTYQDESLRNILRNLRFGKKFNYKLGKDELIIKFKQ